MEDGTIEHGALSQKSLLQLLRMKFSQGSKKARKDAVPTAQPANGDGK